MFGKLASNTALSNAVEIFDLKCAYKPRWVKITCGHY